MVKAGSRKRFLRDDKISYVKAALEQGYTFNEIGTNIDCPELNNGGVIGLYYRKKDSAITLYVYTRPLPGQEHGDYLRYIKVK